jgi:hypothetical protein
MYSYVVSTSGCHVLVSWLHSHSIHCSLSFIFFLLLSPISYLLSPVFLPLCCSLSSVGMSQKVLWKCPVSATYLNGAQSVLGVVSSFMILISLLPVLLCRVCLALWCAKQWSKKCCTDSSPCYKSSSLLETWLKKTPFNPHLWGRKYYTINCWKMWWEFICSMVENPYPHPGLKSSPVFHPIRLRRFCKVTHMNSIPWMAEIYGMIMKIHPKFIHPLFSHLY